MPKCKILKKRLFQKVNSRTFPGLKKTIPGQVPKNGKRMTKKFDRDNKTQYLTFQKCENRKPKIKIISTKNLVTTQTDKYI